MVTYDVNKKAEAYCRELIDSGRYVLESSWSEAQPTTGQENDFIESHGWEAYGKWHLAVVPGDNPETKKRYGFCFGDFEKVHRSGLAAAAERAGEWDHMEVERVAHSLLEHLKKVAGK